MWYWLWKWTEDGVKYHWRPEKWTCTLYSVETFGKLSFAVIWRTANISNEFENLNEGSGKFCLKEIIDYLNKSNNNGMRGL